MARITHTFVSTVADTADPTLVHPTQWNAVHTVALTKLTVTAAGTTVIPSSIDIVIFQKAVASSSPCVLPTVVGRDGVELKIYDWSGTAGDMQFTTPSTAQLIMGATNPLIVGSGGAPGTGGSALLVSVESTTGGANGWLVKG